ncbi:50S ribosomal protein L4 [Patescibacteria group bacterium]|nr:50S ribosomal protein L4 [Patescibacteria group bacterium]MBU4078025.1 50S ribosomal protein L4 [Patescibacteria group bacterium]
MKIDTYNQEGEKTEQTDLPKEVFEQAFNSDLVHQVIVSMQSNRRQGTAHTKDRGEVSGGGRKPWRQKGTGRARHGSTRSPIWIGGGVTFGPTNERNYKKDIPSKMRKKALKCLLSQKLKDKEIFIIDDLKIEEPKTKIITDILEKLSKEIKKEKFKTLLIVSDKKDDKLLRAVKNIPNIDIIEARNLNSLAVVSYRDLLITKKSIKTIKDVLGK